MKELTYRILTPTKIIVDEGKATSLVVPTVMGQISVYPEHTHMLIALAPGELIASAENKKLDRFVITTGVLKILNDHVVFLAKTCERFEDIDQVRAKKAKELALKKLSEEILSDDVLWKYRNKLDRAEIRLRASMLGK